MGARELSFPEASLPDEYYTRNIFADLDHLGEETTTTKLEDNLYASPSFMTMNRLVSSVGR
jgi:hypothetical protein